MSDNDEIVFRKNSNPEETKNQIKKIGMVQSFAMALVSRGLNNKKINKATKQLRVLSCFGNQSSGGILPPCDFLTESNTQQGRHFCGACGCGDKKLTWLVSEGDEYGKLDYPKLSCPLMMPGFTNYKTSSSDESVDPITRKYYIENIDYSEIEKIKVSLNEPDTTNPEVSI